MEYDFNPYEYFTEEEIKGYILSVEDVWKYNRYVRDHNITKYFNDELKEEDVPTNNSVFWNAYIDSNYSKLSEITNGEFDDLYDEYMDYLSTIEYLYYSSWKIDNKHEIQRIFLENTGAYISEGALDVYVFTNYSIISDELNLHYKFGIDMHGLYLLPGYTGKFKNSTYNYDMQNNTFSLEFEQRPSFEDEQNQYQEICNVWTRTIDSLDDFDDSEIMVHCILGGAIYFSISYLDVENFRHEDWYIYSPFDYRLSNVNMYDLDLDKPLITQYKDAFDYYDSYSGYVAKRLGYSNSQYRNWLDYDSEYIYKAEKKLLSDLAQLFK